MPGRACPGLPLGSQGLGPLHRAVHSGLVLVLRSGQQWIFCGLNLPSPHTSSCTFQVCNVRTRLPQVDLGRTCPSGTLQADCTPITAGFKGRPDPADRDRADGPQPQLELI